MVSRAVVERARRQREFPTQAEAILWQRLRGRAAAGFKFRQQSIRSGFIVDFYCARCKLIVELNGRFHDEADCHGRRRKDVLAGLKTVRFTDEQVEASVESVVEAIVRHCRERV